MASSTADHEIDQRVVSRIAHVLWRIEKDKFIKNMTKDERIDAWNKEKSPFLVKARMIIRMADTVDFSAKQES